jgi:hypothetical protein
MDLYFKKYLKYKYKYINLLNQQGGIYANVRDQINMSRDNYIYNFDQDNVFCFDPIYKDKIHVNRAVLINNTIYDVVNLLNNITSEYIKNKSKNNLENYFLMDPNNKKLINVSDLELIYKKVKYQNLINIQEIDKNYDQIIIKSIEQYRKEIEIILGLIKKKICSISSSIKISDTIKLNLIDLKKLNDLLDEKRDCFIDEKTDCFIDEKSFVDIILKQPFNNMFKILLSNLSDKEQIANLLKHIENNTNILDLTINQINKLLTYNLDNQQKILNLANKDIIEYFLLINNVNNQDQKDQILLDINEAKKNSISVNEVVNVETTDIADLEIINKESEYKSIDKILISIKEYRIEEEKIVSLIKSKLPRNHLTFNLNLNLIDLKKLYELLTNYLENYNEKEIIKNILLNESFHIMFKILLLKKNLPKNFLEKIDSKFINKYYILNLTINQINIFNQYSYEYQQKILTFADKDDIEYTLLMSGDKF